MGKSFRVRKSTHGFHQNEYSVKASMVLTAPHKIVEDEDASDKARRKDDKIYIVPLSDCSGCE